MASKSWPSRYKATHTLRTVLGETYRVNLADAIVIAKTLRCPVVCMPSCGGREVFSRAVYGGDLILGDAK